MTKPTTTSIAVRGSLQESQKNRQVTFAEAFLTVEAIVVVDISASMSAHDVACEGGTRSRWEEANAQLALLQAKHPSKIAVVAFSDNTEFCPSGVLPSVQGGTNMLQALQFVAPADDTGIKFIVIADGEVDDPPSTLAFAKTLRTPIDTVFVGTSERGRKFLEELSSTTKGQSAVKSISLLSDTIERLLLS